MDLSYLKDEKRHHNSCSYKQKTVLHHHLQLAPSRIVLLQAIHSSSVKEVGNYLFSRYQQSKMHLS